MAKVILLKTEQDYERFRKSKAYHATTITLRLIKNPNQNSTRFGFIIAKKTVPKASDRNKIKRRLKHILKFNLGRVAAYDVLIFPKKEALHKRYSELQDDLIFLLKKAKLWK